MTYDPVYYTPTRRKDFVPSPVFAGIVAVFASSGAMAWTEFGNAKIDVFLFVVTGWLVSLCLHEYAHAITGYFAGDRSVADRGYLRLNPLKYTSPLLSIVLPVIVVILGGIGLPGGAVWIEHRYINSKVKESLISATGPLTNLALAVLCGIPFFLGLADNVGFDDLGQVTGAHRYFWAALALLAFLQVSATILNLVPIPGLDGGGILQPWLSPQYQRVWRQFAPWGFMVLFVLLWQTRLNGYFYSLVEFFTDGMHIDKYLIVAGLDTLRFWK